MSWTDKKSLETFKRLRDEFDVMTYIETGTFMGDGAAVHSFNFRQVITIELVPEYYRKACRKLSEYPNVIPICGNSAKVLENIKDVFRDEREIVFVYLDAHFYDPTLAPEDRFVVLKELRAMKGWKNCVIAIHDFNCNGLGGLVYDGIPLDFNLVKDVLHEVNPNFTYYTNTKSGCDIITKERVTSGEIPGLTLNETVDDNLTFVWSNPLKTYRGILYATPQPLDLSRYELVRLYE